MFSFEYVRASNPTRQDVEFDNDSASYYETLVMVACYGLLETAGEFRVSGFGLERWPTDITDMSTFLEQVPELLINLRSQRPGIIDMYEQGIERTLTFRPQALLVEVHCDSRTCWRPSPEVETVKYEELIDMFTNLCRNFALDLAIAVPTYADRAPFPEWRRGQV